MASWQLTSSLHADLHALLHATELALCARLHVDLAVFAVATLEVEVAVVSQKERLQKRQQLLLPNC